MGRIEESAAGRAGAHGAHVVHDAPEVGVVADTEHVTAHRLVVSLAEPARVLTLAPKRVVRTVAADEGRTGDVPAREIWPRTARRDREVHHPDVLLFEHRRGAAEPRGIRLIVHA